MSRLTRRLTLLRAKRNGCWDPDQAWYETAPRARAARAVRVHLRRMEPVMLVAPRWSEPHRFLDELGCDLALGKPDVVTRTLNLAPLAGRTIPQAWAWLLQALQEFCAIRQDGPATSAVSSQGFHRVLRSVLERASTGPRRCLMFHGTEHAPLDALTDLVETFTDAAARRNSTSTGLNLLLSGSLPIPSCTGRFVQLQLPDFGLGEATEALAEQAGAVPPTLLAHLVKVVGGVPALIEAVGRLDLAHQGEIVADRAALWKLLGALGDEVRGAAHILASDLQLAQRMETIARRGPVVADLEQDAALLRSGLVTLFDRRRIRLRAPVFADAVT